MQPNVIAAESIGHRARFVWLGLALAATIALLVIPALTREDARATRAERATLDRSMYRVHRCHGWRPTRVDAERAKQAGRAVERAERTVERAIEQAERAAERAERALKRAERARHRHHHHGSLDRYE